MIQLKVTQVQQDMSLQIFDLNGRQVIFDNIRQINGNINTSLNLTNLPKGVYLLKLNNSKQSGVQKILII